MMNEAQKRAVESAIANVQDDLLRAKWAQRRDPNWKSGNGETIDEVIAGYEKHLAELAVNDEG